MWWQENYEQCSWNHALAQLTPTEKRYEHDKTGGRVRDDKSELQEHEQSISKHPHGGHQGEVVEKCRGQHTDLKRLCLVNTSHEEHQHENHGHTQLQPELAVGSLAQLTKGRRGEDEPRLGWQVH